MAQRQENQVPSKTQRYDRLISEIGLVLEGEPHRVARMATIACLLHEAFADRIWTGFYLVDETKKDQLVVGPYQGSLGCLRIDFSRGVCGAAATRGQTIIVENVHDFPGHIACDSRSVSEIVVPVWDPSGRLIAVLDIDSDKPAQFDREDQQALERLVKNIFAKA